MQIQEGLYLHNRPGCAKRIPRINWKAKVYFRRVEGVNSRIQIDRQRVLRIKMPDYPNQVLRKVCVDQPRSIWVCIGKCVSRYLSTSKSHFVKLGCLRSQIHFYIVLRLAINQLRKGHCKELIEASLWPCDDPCISHRIAKRREGAIGPWFERKRVCLGTYWNLTKVIRISILS